MGNFKAQAAVEYIMIIGMVLVVTIPLFYYAARESNSNIKLNTAEDAVNTLAKAADVVYAIGPGTKKYVWINIPKGVEGYSTAEKTVLINVSMFGGYSDISARAKAELIGVIPTAKGRHKVLVEMLESGYVQFGVAADTTAPVVTWTDPDGTINYNGIWIRATTNEYATCKYKENTSDTDIDMIFDDMPDDLVGSALTHEKDLGILDDGHYVYYVRCMDVSSNLNQMTSSAKIEFTITTSDESGGAEEYDSPVVTLIGPENNNKTNESIIKFQFNVTDQSSISFCELIIDNVTKQPDSTVTRNITQNFTQGISFGNHTWNVNCTDIHGNRNSSFIWDIETNATEDVYPPIVNLEKPDNNSVRNSFLVRFYYNVTDPAPSSGIDHCYIHMSGIMDNGLPIGWSIKYSPIEEEPVTEEILLPLIKANYTWNVSCVDKSYSANEGYSETWKLRVNKSAGEAAFLDSCAGLCGGEGYATGECRTAEQGDCINKGGFSLGSGTDVYCPNQPSIWCCCFA